MRYHLSLAQMWMSPLQWMPSHASQAMGPERVMISAIDEGDGDIFIGVDAGRTKAADGHDARQWA